MIYDNGTVTQQASLMQMMAEKAKAYDDMVKKDAMKGAFSTGVQHGVESTTPVIDGLAAELAKAHIVKGY